jgi:hypothetical protein
MPDQLIEVIADLSTVTCLPRARRLSACLMGSIINLQWSIAWSQSSMFRNGTLLAQVHCVNAVERPPPAMLLRKKLDLTQSHSRLHVKMIFIDFLFTLG